MRFSSLKNLGYKVSAAMIAGFLVGMDAHSAQAQNITLPKSSNYNLDSLVQFLGNQTRNIPDLIAVFSYVGGAAFTAFGIISTKKHIDNPTNDPLQKGLGQLAAGAGLVTLPSLTDILINTIGLEGGQGATVQDFGSEFKPN